MSYLIALGGLIGGILIVYVIFQKLLKCGVEAEETKIQNKQREQQNEFDKMTREDLDKIQADYLLNRNKPLSKLSDGNLK